MVTIQFGEAPPKGVAFEIILDGKTIAGVIHHPWKPGMWMAVTPPKDHRDCGWKRFKTQAGAARYVLRSLQQEAAE